MTRCQSAILFLRLCAQIVEIHSCISLIEQAAGLPFNLLAEIGDLTFQLHNIGGELVSVEGVSDRLGKPVDPGLHDEAAGIPLYLGSASNATLRSGNFVNLSLAARANG